MKLMNTLFAALILFGMSNAAFGFNYTFTNKTDKSIKVKIVSKFSPEPNVKYDMRGKTTNPISLETQIQPEGKYTFQHQVDMPYCLTSVSVDNEEIGLPKRIESPDCMSETYVIKKTYMLEKAPQ